MRGKGRLGLKVVVAAVTRPLSSARIGEAPVDQSFIFLRGFSLEALLELKGLDIAERSKELGREVAP